MIPNIRKQKKKTQKLPHNTISEIYHQLILLATHIITRVPAVWKMSIVRVINRFTFITTFNLHNYIPRANLAVNWPCYAPDGFINIHKNNKA